MTTFSTIENIFNLPTVQNTFIKKNTTHVFIKYSCIQKKPEGYTKNEAYKTAHLFKRNCNVPPFKKIIKKKKAFNNFHSYRKSVRINIFGP